MIRRRLAFALATSLSLALAACSDSDGGSSGEPGGGGGGTGTGGGGGTTGGGSGGGGTTGGPPPAPSGSGAPSGDTKAGTYFGDFGSGNGVYVIDEDNRLAGLATREDGSAISLFGELGDGNSYSGTLRQQVHDASTPATAGGFGTGDDTLDDVGPYELTFTPGESISSSGGQQAANLNFVTDGAIPPATIATVAGDWTGVNEYGDCSGDGGCQLVFDVTFDGTAVSGTTSIAAGDGSRTFEQPISGTIAEYGNVLLLNFNWGADERLNLYRGVAFFRTDEPNRLVFLGETDAESDNPTIASLLGQ